MAFIRVRRWRAALFLPVLAAAAVAAAACAVDAAEPPVAAWPELLDCMSGANAMAGTHYGYWPKWQMPRYAYYASLAQRCGADLDAGRVDALAQLPDGADCFDDQHSRGAGYIAAHGRGDNTQLAAAYAGYVCAERDYAQFQRSGLLR